MSPPARLPMLPSHAGGEHMTRGSKIVDLAEKRRELRGHITETGELVTFESLRRERGHDEDEGPPAA